jgi:ligand-binding sensor domain-containing protein
VGGHDNPTLDVAQSVTLPEEWIAGTRMDGVWRSSDGGENWSLALDTDSSVTAVAIDPARMQRMAAASWGAGLHISRDGGKTWTNRTRGLPTAKLVEVAFDAGKTGRLWVGTVERGIYYTDNLGASWNYAGMNGTMVFDMVYPQ